MLTRSSSDSSLTEHERDVLVRLEAMGWFVNKIAADDNGPGFAYSFGLYKTFQHPEIILFGLPVDMMHQLINDIGKHSGMGHRHIRMAVRLLIFWRAIPASSTMLTLLGIKPR